MYMWIRARVVLCAVALLISGCVAADESQAAEQPLNSSSAESSADDNSATTTTTSSRLRSPPPLLVVSSGGTVESASRGYCWIDECAEHAGLEPPVVIADGPVMLTFAADGFEIELEAEGGCTTGATGLDKIGDQEWELIWTGPPGRRVFVARASGPDGSADFSFAIDATVGFGPDVPDAGFRGFYSQAETPPSPELLLRLSSSDPELRTPKSIILNITGVDGRATELEITEQQTARDCMVIYQVNGFATIDIIDQIGLGDWAYEFLLETNDGRWFNAGFGPGDTQVLTPDVLTALSFEPTEPVAGS